MKTKPDVVDMAAIAERTGVPVNTLKQRRKRNPGALPPPDYELAGGPAWLWETVEPFVTNQKG